jgi:hypothetical protein
MRKSKLYREFVGSTELFQTVPERIGLRFEILFSLMPNMMKIGKKCLKPIFQPLLADGDLSCNQQVSRAACEESSDKEA